MLFDFIGCQRDSCKEGNKNCHIRTARLCDLMGGCIKQTICEVDTDPYEAGVFSARRAFS